MKVVMNVKREHIYFVFATIALFAGMLAVDAYTADGSGVPSEMGHSADELDFSSGINGDVFFNDRVGINQGGSYDIWLQGGVAGSSGGARNLALLGVKSSDELRLNYGGEYAGGVRVQGTKMRIDGNLGIGTGSPGAKLDVNADTTTAGGWYEAIRFSQAAHSAITHPAGGLLFGLHSNRNFYFADIAGGVMQKYVMIIEGDTGNVGIGKTPAQKLDVQGNIKASGTVCDGSGDCIGDGGGAGETTFVSGSNPTCPSGYEMISRKWTTSTCSSSGNACSLYRGWSGAPPMCESCVDWERCHMCSSSSWNQVMCVKP